METLRIEDLDLAHACAHGQTAALHEFRARFGPAIRHAVRTVAPAAIADEVVQRVFTKLFAGQCAIRSYNGSGKLSTWVQVVARREAVTAMRAERRHELDTATEAELILRHTNADHELPAGIKEQYRLVFKLAFERALGSLSPRERNLLRYECFDQLTIESIASIYQVSVSTIARWRAVCRARLFRLTRDQFRMGAAVSEDDFDSVMRLIESQLEISLSRILASDAA